MRSLLKPLILLAQVVRRAYWRLARPMTLGVRAIVLDEQDRVLLVKHTYASGWYLPGGGVKKGETTWSALQRELRQEVDVEAGEVPAELLGTYLNRIEGKVDYVVVYVVQEAKASASRRSIEVDTVRYFPLQALPERISPATQRRIAEYMGASSVEETW